MNRKFIPSALDTAFVTVATFSACFVFLRFYSKSLWLALIVSAGAAIAVAIIFRLVQKRKSAKYSLKKEDADFMEKVLNTLCLMRENQLTEFFSSLLLKMQIPHEIEGDGVFLKDNNTTVRFYFSFSKTYEGKIIDFYKQTEEGRDLLVIGREFSEEIKGLTKRFSGRIRLLDGTNFYLVMKRFEHFPEVKEDLSPTKNSFNLPRALFSKKRARQYFLYGLTLEFFSFFVFYPLYYICFGCALIIFSIICFFFGIKDEPEMLNPFK